MKIIVLTAFLLIVSSCSKTNSISGKVYEGRLVKAGPQVGCEGCGNRGRISFIDSATVDVNRPGDDQIFRRSYSQNGQSVTTDDGDVFTISEDLKSLTALYGTFLLKED